MSLKKIWLSPPHMCGMEKKFVQQAFDTNWIAPLGPLVEGFEEDLKSFTGAGHVAALNSGTAALHLALILLGIKEGDEVLCQSFTFSASANPIVYLGAVPVFVDSEKETWNMSPVFLEEAIQDRIKKGKKPAAIIAVDLYGMPAKMEEILSIAEKYDIPVIEDAAEALGANVRGKKCGTFGKLNILSFNGNKIITTSGGGALLSDDESLISKARFLATQARDDAPHYQHSQIGYNYRLSNVLAGIGRGQMTVIVQRVEQRRENFDRYKALFDKLGDRGYAVEFQGEPDGFYSNRWLTTIIIDPVLNKGITREDMRLAFVKANIDSRPLWKPLHLQPIFNQCVFYGNGTAESLFEYGLCLPSGTNLDLSDFNRIAEVINSLFA